MDILWILNGGFSALWDYLLAHTLFCLVPAFFIAGAISTLVPKSAILPYLGKKSPRIIAYPLAVISGLLLAVCSCTVLPLFAGIRKSGAGLGPALVFLYTAPATNIIAILYTGNLIGWDIALARIFFSVLFAITIGVLVSRFFPDSEEEIKTTLFEKKDPVDLNRVIFLLLALLSILLAGTRIEEELLRYALVALCTISTGIITLKWFSKSEQNAWFSETWSFAKTIVPLLIAGVFLSGIIRVLLPMDVIPAFFGSTTLLAVAIPVLFGIFVYFPTLVEVPLAKTFLDLGMAKGPLLAYLLADPVVSLPSLLVVRKIMGTKRTLAYALLIFVLSIAAGLAMGAWAG